MPWETVIATVFQAGNRVVINSAGFFVYNGAPTLGNLLATIVNSGGTDQFGNVYVPGISIYNGKQFVNINDVPPPTINFTTGAATEDEPATLFTDITNTGLANEFMTLFLTGPSSASDDTRAVVQLLSSQDNGTVLANGGLYVFQGNTQLNNPLNWTADTQVWHNFGSFLNSWQQNTSAPTCRYRKTVLNELELQGGLSAVGTPSAVIFFQLPAGYRPTNQGYFLLQPTSVTTTGQYFGTCDTSGNLTINGTALGTTGRFLFEGTFPLN